MPIGSLLDAKDASPTYQPLLLATVTFSDATVLRLSTHDLTGGAIYGGNSYLPRVMNSEMAAMQALGEQGIDVPTSVNLRLSDADYTLWTNYELAHGFKGARLEMRAVMYDALAGGFSSDSRVIFRGVCREPGGKMPAHDGKVLTVGFASRLNMADVSIPSIKIQKTCPWIFPQNSTERQAAADDSESLFYRCGYSPDATGANARGTGSFTTCDYTATNCKERGMFSVDGSARATARFGGIQWNPDPAPQRVRDYVTKKWEEVSASSNEARYGDYVPMLWGQSWTDPLVLSTLPDGNRVQIRALVCFGALDAIWDVQVNDVHIPHTYDDTRAPISTGIGVPNATEAAKGGWWKCLNNGDRSGSVDGVTNEDPYGSYCVLNIVCPKTLVAPGSMPRVRVYATRGTAFPAEQTREILRDWAGWDSAELNSGTFDDSADVDAAVIAAPGSRYRFTSSLYLRQRESVADVIRGLRNSRRGIIGPDENGLLCLRTEQTLADQQPAPVAGSNYDTAIASQTSAGIAANGYAAYRFDESNILGIPSVSLGTAGNRYAIQFHNKNNQHSEDALHVIDSDDIRRSDREIPGTFTLGGADNYEQVKQLVATYVAKQLRGNARDDTGGSVVLEFPASFRAVHLRIGDLCLVNWQLLGIADQLFRVIRIAPETNFETARLALTWHNDDWYLDSFGQGGIPEAAMRFRDRLARPAFPWKPYHTQPATSDSIFSNTEWTFGVAPSYERGGGEEAIASLAITGKQPVNVTAAALPPPVVPLQGTTASTGGTISGARTICVAIAAKNAAGEYSSLSPVVLIGVPSGTNTNTVTVPSLTWDANATGYAVFAGLHAGALSFQATAGTTPSSITLTSLSESLWGPPDTEFDRLRFRVKRVWHGGVWGAQVVAVTSTTIQIAVDGSFTTNEYAGYDVSWLGAIDSQAAQPLASFRVASNTADTLTFTGSPNPSTLGIVLGDVVVMRSKPTFGTDGDGDYIEDAAWESAFYPAGMVVDEEVGRLVRIIAGTGRGTVARIKKNTATKIYCDFPVQPDSTSRYIVEDAKWDVIEDTDSINNGNPAAETTVKVNVSNYIGQTVLVQALTLDGGGNESVEAFSPLRELYLFGQGLIWKTVTTDYEMTDNDQAIAADTSAGSLSVTLPAINAGRERSRKRIVKKITGDANTCTVLPPAGSTIDGNAAEILTDAGDCVTYAGDGA